MVSNESDSESECFESAEENLEEEEEEEEKLERKTKSKRNSRKSESEIAEHVVSQNDKKNETVYVKDVSVNLSYRKRPERIKHTPSIPPQKVNCRIKKPSDAVFKTDVADVFFQDITSNLSKNINKSLCSLQQTSSNVKDLILSTLPSPSSCEEIFVYDENLDIIPTPVENKILSNDIFDDKTIFTNDCLRESPKVKLAQNHEANLSDIPDKQRPGDEMFDLKKKCLEINSGDNLINRNTNSISGLENRHIKNFKIDKIIGSEKLEFDKFATGAPDGKSIATMDNEKGNVKNSKECYSQDQLFKDSELNNENIFEDQVNKVSLGQSEIETSLPNNSNSNKPDSDEQKNIEGKELNFPNKIVPPCAISKADKIDVKTSLKIPNSSDNLVVEEFYLYSTNAEENLDTDCQNTSLESIKNTNEGSKIEFDKKKKITDKNNEKYHNNKMDFSKTQELTRLNDLRKNADELKTDNEIITKENKVNDKNETLERGTPETDFNMKESNEISKDWDDFDFSDNEIEGINTKDINKCAHSDKSTGAKEIKLKKDILTEDSEFVENKADMNFEAQKISNKISSKKNLINESFINEDCKVKDTSEKEKFDESWEWETWDDESEETKGESVHKTTAENYDKAENIPDDKIKWSGWDSFSQRIEEKQGNWNLGTWGVNLLLNKATAVTQGISNVLEAGLGAPDPETLARIQIEKERKLIQEMEKSRTDEQPEDILKKDLITGVNLFPVSGITNLVVGVTSKIVEHTKIQEIGSKVLTGGLDTLETFGKKTMEVLQDGDPGLRNKRALLTGNNKPVLSQILKEAREKAEKEIKEAEEKAFAKNCHFETLFDDFQGMVHLEALEMLSRQYEIKLDQFKNGMSSEELEDLEGVLEEVEQLCALDDLDVNSVLDFKTSLQMAVEPLKEEISVEKIIQIHDNANKWLQTASELDSSQISLHQKAVSTVAELTAATVHQFLKAGELLSIKECRKTVDEVDALARLTNILCMEINKICEKFILIAQEKSKRELVSADTISEKIIIMRNNSTSYIRQAFDLLLPVLQAGAAL